MAPLLPSTASPWRTSTATPRHNGQNWTGCSTISHWSTATTHSSFFAACCRSWKAVRHSLHTLFRCSDRLISLLFPYCQCLLLHGVLLAASLYFSDCSQKYIFPWYCFRTLERTGKDMVSLGGYENPQKVTTKSFAGALMRVVFCTNCPFASV